MDASSYPGYKKAAAGDMKIIPDNNVCILDPFSKLKTLSITCDIFEPDESTLPQDTLATLLEGLRDIYNLNPERYIC
jgi:glutamine synthetase